MKSREKSTVNAVGAKQRIPAIYLVRLLEVIRANDIDISPILQHLGLELAYLQSPNAMCTVQHRLQVLEYVRRIKHIPGLGLRVGTQIMIHDHGIVGYAILSSINLQNAMDIIARYHQLSNPAVRCTYHTDGDDVVITEAPVIPYNNFARIYHLEEMLGAWIPIGALLHRGRFDFTEVRVPWNKPSHSCLYEQIFQCEILYGQPDCGVRFDRKLLDEPVCLASPETALLCEYQCNILANVEMGKDRIVNNVRSVLFSRPGRFPTLDEVASLLDLSPRTLRRRLQEAGTTFRDTLDGLRMDVACSYLENSEIPIKTIAFLVGFTEPSNFHRAFKRRLGNTPQSYKNSSKTRRAKPAHAERISNTRPMYLEHKTGGSLTA